VKEHAREVLPEVAVEPADYTEVEVNDNPVVPDEYVAGVKIRVEYSVLEYLFEEYPDAPYRDLFYVDALCFEGFDLVDGSAICAPS
jgi:hypothetical protein